MPHYRETYSITVKSNITGYLKHIEASLLYTENLSDKIAQIEFEYLNWTILSIILIK